jgi:hypothetical protein
MDILCTADMCPVILNSTCVFYEGNNLTYTGINTNDSLQTALQKIDAKFGNAMVGYIFTNGLVQLSPGQPVKLGGSLIENTTIGGNFTLSFVGPIIGSKLATAGGTASEFLKGDGTLDNTPYQVAGAYITNLSGDVVASGPGTAVATLASVNANPGVYGDGTHVPRITVDSKGRVTAVTSTAISLPSSVLSFTGDVYGSGSTGSTTTLTLNDVNLNVYTNNTFLKFKVNAKGLVTGATPVTGLDINSALGFTPVPNTRTITINGITQTLQADRSWTLPGGGSVTNVSATAGTGISVSVTNPATTPNITITNTAPDQVVSIAAGTGINVTGSYPNFTVAATNAGTVTGVTASAPLASSGGTTPNITISQASTSTDGYLSSTDWNTFNSKQAAGNYITALTGEATASGPGSATVTLSNAAVTGKVLTGVNVTGGTVVATDTILEGFGKLQNQINGLIGGSIYQGVWDAATNTPTLVSGVGTNGYYYIVNVAGNTNLNGITSWNVGDWAIFHGGIWQKVDNTDAVVSVNGQTGAVSLTTDNISEGATNKYFTVAAARQSISLTTTGTSGAATYDNVTGVLNIPQYQGGVTSFNTRTGAVTLSSTDVTDALGYTPYNSTNPAGYITSAALAGYVPTTRTLTINGTTYDLSADRTWTISTAGGLPTGGTAGQILAKIDTTDYNTQWIDNYAEQVKNPVKLGATLTKGTPVYESSADGTNIIVSASSNVSEATSSKTLGLLETGGATNAIVKVVTYGLLAGLDTSAANAAGDPVWLGPNGTLLYGLANKPVAPAHLVYIGVVTRKQSNNGEIFINIQNGFELDELHDVLISAPKVDGQGIFLETISGKQLWVNKSISSALGYTPANAALTISTTAPLQGGGDLSANRTFSITQSATSTDGYLSSTDWNTFNGKQAGSANLTSLATLAFVSESFVKMTGPNTFALDTTAYYPASNPNGYTSNTGTVTSVAALTIGTTGTDISSSVATGTTTPVITLNIPTASATNRGALSAADWATFNSKQNAFTGTTNYIPKFTGTSTIGNSILFNGAAGIGINTATPRASLDVVGNIYSNDVWIQDNYNLLFGDLTAGASSTYIYGVGGSGTNYLGFATNGSEAARILASRQLKLNAYTSTSSFTGTAAGYLAFDSSGNILSVAAPSGGVTGSGTTGYLTKFTGSTAVGNSIMSESGTTVTVAGNISVTASGGNGVNTGVISRDVTAARSSNTGVIYLGSDGAHYLYFDSANYQLPTGGLYVGGLVSCTSLTETSSERYKENIVTLDGSLNKVLNLRGVSYDRKDTKQKEIGVIAEEVEKIIPEVIKYNDDNQVDSVSYGRLTAILIEAIKEQQKQIDELKSLLGK